jgi:mannose-1-phosphate guanylyltransferase
VIEKVLTLNEFCQSKSTKWLQMRRFWEKPKEGVAKILMARGCLWNSFVLAGTVSGFNRLIQKAAPLYYSFFAGIKNRVGTPKEVEAVGRLYRSLAHGNFSDQILTRRGSDLTLLRVTGVAWNDLGTPERVLGPLAQRNHRKTTVPVRSSPATPAADRLL